MTAFYVTLSFLTAAVILACIVAVGVACGYVTVRRPPQRKTTPKEPTP